MIVGIRHGEVWNPDGIVYGRLPGYGLSERGRTEAAELADALEGEPIRAVFASPLLRARQTAAILAEPHGLEVRVDRRLTEWGFWTHWEGLRWTAIRERDPGLLDAYAQDPAGVREGESLAAAADRILDWANDAEARLPRAVSIGVTHEAPLKAALLAGSAQRLGGYHALNLPHLACVRLLPSPAERVEPGSGTLHPA